MLAASSKDSVCQNKPISDTVPRTTAPETSQLNREKQGKNDAVMGEYVESEAWKYISQRFGPEIRQQELLSIATVLSGCCNLQISRAEKRKKDCLIKWFHNHWDIVSPFMQYVVLLDAPESE